MAFNKIEDPLLQHRMSLGKLAPQASTSSSLAWIQDLQLNFALLESGSLCARIRKKRIALVFAQHKHNTRMTSKSILKILRAMTIYLLQPAGMAILGDTTLLEMMQAQARGSPQRKASRKVVT